MPQDKLPIPEFAAKIKAKYPVYKDMNDTALVEKILAKYPQYANDVDMSGISKKKESESDTTTTTTPSPAKQEPQSTSLPPKQETPGIPASKDKPSPLSVNGLTVPRGLPLQSFSKLMGSQLPDYGQIDVDANKKVNDMTGSQLEDPLSHIYGAAMAPNQTPHDRAVTVRAAKMVRDKLIPDGYEAKKVLATTHFGNKNASNLTATEIKNRADKYDKNVAPLRELPVPTEPYGNNDNVKQAYMDLLQNAAIKWYAGEHSDFRKELGNAKIDIKDPDVAHRIPDEKRGQIFNIYLNNKDVLTYLKKENPKLIDAYEYAAKNNIKQNTNYGINVVATEVSQAIEKSGYNKIEPIFNYWGKNSEEYANKIAEGLYKDDPDKMAIYNNFIRNNQHKYIDAPSLLEGVASEVKEAFTGIGRTASLPFTSRDERQHERWIEEASTVNADPRGLMGFLRNTGKATGFVMTLAAGGEIGEGIGLSAGTAQKTMVGLSFFGNEMGHSEEKYKNPLLAFTDASIKTGMFMAMSDIFPSVKAKAAFNEIKPELSEVIENLTAGKITKEIARKEANSLMVKAIDFGTKALSQNTKMSLEMTGVTAANQALDRIFGLNDEQYNKEHPSGELMDTFTSMFTSNGIVSAFSAAGEMKRENKVFDNAAYSVGTNPMRYWRAIENAGIKDPSLNVGEMFDNLTFLANTKVDLDKIKNKKGEPLTEKEKKEYLSAALKEKVMQKQIDKMPDETMQRAHGDDVKFQKEIKENILKGEPGRASVVSAVVEIGGKTYEGKNHAEALLKAKEAGEDITKIDRQVEGKFKLSDGTIIDRAEAMNRFGRDHSEQLIPQDEASKKADEDYKNIGEPATAATAAKTPEEIKTDSVKVVTDLAKEDKLGLYSKAVSTGEIKPEDLLLELAKQRYGIDNEGNVLPDQEGVARKRAGMADMFKGSGEDLMKAVEDVFPDKQSVIDEVQKPKTEKVGGEPTTSVEGKKEDIENRRKLELKEQEELGREVAKSAVDVMISSAPFDIAELEKQLKYANKEDKPRIQKQIDARKEEVKKLKTKEGREAEEQRIVDGYIKQVNDKYDSELQKQQSDADKKTTPAAVEPVKAEEKSGELEKPGAPSEPAKKEYVAPERREMTVAATLKEKPFLKKLFEELGIKGAKKVTVITGGDVAKIEPVWHDAYVRYISWGKKGEEGNVQYGGSSTNPQDYLAHGAVGEQRMGDVEKKLKPDTFFAVVDYGGGKKHTIITLFEGKEKVALEEKQLPESKKEIEGEKQEPEAEQKPLVGQQVDVNVAGAKFKAVVTEDDGSGQVTIKRTDNDFEMVVDRDAVKPAETKPDEPVKPKTEKTESKPKVTRIQKADLDNNPIYEVEVGGKKVYIQRIEGIDTASTGWNEVIPHPTRKGEWTGPKGEGDVGINMTGFLGYTKAEAIDYLLKSDYLNRDQPTETKSDPNQPVDTKQPQDADGPTPQPPDNVKEFNATVDDIAGTVKDWIKKNLSAKLPEGTQKQGAGLEDIVDFAAGIVKQAYVLGNDIKLAVEKAIQHVSDNWDKAWGDFNDFEKEFRLRFSRINPNVGKAMTKQEIQQLLDASRANNPKFLERAKEYVKGSPVARLAVSTVRTFDPFVGGSKNNPSIYNDSRMTAILLRKSLGKMQHENEMASRESEEFARFFEGMDEADRVMFITNIERGIDMGDQKLNGIAKRYKDRMDKVFEAIKAIKDVPYLEDYFPHFWADPEAAKRVFAKTMAKNPMEGNKSFLRARFYSDIVEGMKGGLQLVTTNPEDLVRLAEINAYKFTMAHDFFNALKDHKLVQFHAAGNQPAGWSLVDDPLFKRVIPTDKGAILSGGWYMPHEAAEIVKRYSSRGLKGPFVDTIRGFNNMLNQAQLGISFFHGMTTTIDAAVTSNALGIDKILRGKIGSGLWDLGSGVTIFPNLIRQVYVGNKAIKDFRSGVINKNVEMMMAANARTGVDVIYRTDMVDKFRRAWAGHQYGKVLARAVPAAFDLVAKPIFEGLVPRLKVGGFVRVAENELSKLKNPNQEQIDRTIQKVWDDMENRLGQMTYDNLFWNKTTKDIAFLATRSVGWNLGTIRAFAEGAADLPKSLATGVTGRGISPRTAWAMALVGQTALMGAMTTYLMTGEKPKDWRDYFYPRTGGKDKNGNDKRIQYPTYMKEVFNTYQRGVLHELLAKSSPLINQTLEPINNQDFYGNQIRDPLDPPWQQGIDVLKYEAEQAIPFAWRDQPGEKPTTTEEAVKKIGITPAPQYVIKGKDLSHLYQTLKNIEGDVRDIRKKWKAGAMSDKEYNDQYIKLANLRSQTVQEINNK